MDARLVRYLQTLGVGPEALDGWTVQVAQRDGKDVGFFLSKGPEVHMLAFEDGAMTRKNITTHLQPVFDEFGYVTTRTPISETDDKLRLVLGFEKTWSDERFQYWAMTSMPFRRKHRE